MKQDTQSQCSGTTQRDGVGREVGGGSGWGDICAPMAMYGKIHVNVWQKTPQYCTERESCSVMSDSLRPHGLYSLWNSPDQNTRVGSLFLLQGIFPTPGSNSGLQHCRQSVYQLSHQGSPRVLEWVAYPFSTGSSRPRN